MVAKKGSLFVHIINLINPFTDQACAILISHLVNNAYLTCIWTWFTILALFSSKIIAITAKGKWLAHFGTCICITILWLDFFYYYLKKASVYCVHALSSSLSRRKRPKYEQGVQSLFFPIFWAYYYFLLFLNKNLLFFLFFSCWSQNLQKYWKWDHSCIVF